MRKILIPKDLLEKIVTDYQNNIKLGHMSQKYQLTLGYIQKLLRKNNIPCRSGFSKRKYIFDERLFQHIDNQEKAYWIGLLMADGYVAHGNIKLTLKDAELIYKFRKFIGNIDIPIKDRKNCAGKLNQKHIDIFSVKMTKDLLQYGLIANKTYRTQILNIPQKFLPDFIRGYFDGDGCLYHEKNFRRCEMTIASCSEKILLQIQTVLKENNIIQRDTYISASKNKKCSYFRIKNKKELLNFCRFIYKDAFIFLQRKYDKYQLIKEKMIYNKNKNGKSRYFGVYPRSDKSMIVKGITKKFDVALRYNGKQLWLGSFYTEIEAAQKYNEKATELGFPKEKLNIIPLVSGN